MGIFPGIDTFDDPARIASSPAFTRLVLERIAFKLHAFMSPEMVAELRMRPELPVRHMGDQIAYGIEGVVYGREARSRVVERTSKKEKKEVADPTRRFDRRTETVPLTWRDHWKQTLRMWLAGKAIKAEEAMVIAAGGSDSLRRPPLYSAVRWRAWEWILHQVRRRLPFKERVLTLESEHVTHVHVENVTKHIEVHKHWHTCPHLGIQSKQPHYVFLVRSDVRWPGLVRAGQGVDSKLMTEVAAHSRVFRALEKLFCQLWLASSALERGNCDLDYSVEAIVQCASNVPAAFAQVVSDAKAAQAVEKVEARVAALEKAIGRLRAADFEDIGGPCAHAECTYKGGPGSRREIEACPRLVCPWRDDVCGERENDGEIEWLSGCSDEDPRRQYETR